MSLILELKSMCPGLASDLEQAAETIETQPNVTLDKISCWGQNLIKILAAFEEVKEPIDGSVTTLINTLSNQGLLPAILRPFFLCPYQCTCQREFANSQCKAKVIFKP